MKSNKIIYIKVADFNFKISFEKINNSFYSKSVFMLVKMYFSGFVIKKPPPKIHGTIIITNKVLLKQKNIGNDIYIFGIKKKYLITTTYGISPSQLRALFDRLLFERLKEEGQFLKLHLSAVKSSQGAIIFLGKSGAGKTTITSLLRPKMKILANDMAIVRKIRNEVRLFQFPTLEHEIGIKKSYKYYPVHKVYFLQKSNSITKKRLTLEGRLALTTLVSKGNQLKLRKTMTDLITPDNSYILQFTNDIAQVDKLYKVVNSQ